MIHYISASSRLAYLNLSNNNLRGSTTGTINTLMQSFCDMGVLRHLDLSNNLLGKEYGMQLDKKPAPICILSDVLIKSHSLKILNISNNMMAGNAALSIAHGLSHTEMLESIDVSGNPIGKAGMKMML